MNSLPLPEFEAIARILKDRVALEKNPPINREWLAVGDDCAAFDGWLITKDLSVENTHFRLDWSTPEEAIEKHVISNVSDISAMGGVPKLALFGFCVNKNWPLEVRARFEKAIAENFRKRNIALIGGDTVSATVGMFSTTLLGVQTAGTLLTRAQAKENDSVFIAGTLGKSAAGLWILENHPEDKNLFPELVQYHLNPQIDERMGEKLARLGVNGACLDISDGLSSELNHLSLSSGVSIEIFEENLPIDPSVKKMCHYYGLSPLEFALNGGEEYELLFTFSQEKDIFKETGNVYKIGTVKKGSQVFMHKISGEKVLINPCAWSHL